MTHEVKVFAASDGLIICHCVCNWSEEAGYDPSVTNLINIQTAHRLRKAPV